MQRNSRTTVWKRRLTNCCCCCCCCFEAVVGICWVLHLWWKVKTGTKLKVSLVNLRFHQIWRIKLRPFKMLFFTRWNNNNVLLFVFTVAWLWCLSSVEWMNEGKLDTQRERQPLPPSFSSSVIDKQAETSSRHHNINLRVLPRFMNEVKAAAAVFDLKSSSNVWKRLFSTWKHLHEVCGSSDWSSGKVCQILN